MATFKIALKLCKSDSLIMEARQCIGVRVFWSVGLDSYQIDPFGYTVSETFDQSTVVAYTNGECTYRR